MKMLPYAKHFILGLVFGVLLVGSITAVKAYFSKKVILGDSTVSAAKIDLSTSTQSALINLSDIEPGYVSNEKTLELTNNGTTNIKYTLTIQPKDSSSDNVLFNSLTYKINVYDFANNIVYSEGNLGAGDLVKNISALKITEFIPKGQIRKLGFIISLPSSADSSVEGLSANFKIVFDVYQESGPW